MVTASYAAAIVGLERMYYEVEEDGGVVEVCVIVSFPDIECPIQFHFSVSITTNHVTTGEQVLLIHYTTLHTLSLLSLNCFLHAFT